MEIAEIKMIARRRPFFLLRLSKEYKEVVINIVNEAFDRDYKSEDMIEVLSYKAFSIRSDRERFYELKLAPVTGHGLALCLSERESLDSTDGTAQISFDELVLNTGNVAMVTSQDFDRDYRKMYCIIDTPGGAVKFAIPTVRLRYPSRQIIDVFRRWAD